MRASAGKYTETDEIFTTDENFFTPLVLLMYSLKKISSANSLPFERSTASRNELKIRPWAPERRNKIAKISRGKITLAFILTNGHTDFHENDTSDIIIKNTVFQYIFSTV